MNYNEVLAEVRNIAFHAIVSNDDAIKRIALGDIADVVARVIRGTSAASEEEIHEAATEEPVTVGCPSLVPPRVIPHDEPAAEVHKTLRTQEEYFKQHYSLCDGAFHIRRGNSEESVVESVWVGDRRFTMETVVTNKVEGVNHGCEFTIRDNGRIRCSGRYYGGKAIGEKIAHSALKAYITNLGGGGGKKYKHRGGFLKQAFDRLQAKEKV